LNRELESCRRVVSAHAGGCGGHAPEVFSAILLIQSCDDMMLMAMRKREEILSRLMRFSEDWHGSPAWQAALPRVLR
jgi:hypothetical protein